MIYLDNAATTRPCAEAVAAVNDALTARWGNPSAVHRLGIEAARLLRTARQDVAEAMGAETERVFFTSGGTEADNWAIFSAAERLGKRGRHIVTTAVEHHAVLHPMQKLEQQGFSVTYLQPDAEGRVSLEALQAALRPDTILVSIMMVNNESGAVMPIERMARLTHRVCPNALFHTDAVQGFFKVPFRARTLGADLISVSAHKVHGIKGAGALYIRPGLSLPPFVLGGGQDCGLRRRLPRRSAEAHGVHRPAAPPSGAGTGAAPCHRRRAAARRAGSAAHSESRRAGCPLTGTHQRPAGARYLRLGRFGLQQGPPQPCARGHGR